MNLDWKFRYIACALDTEGHIACCKISHPGRKTNNFCIEIGFTNNNLEWLKFLEQLIQLKAHLRKRKNSNAWCLEYWKQPDVLTLLKSIQPFMIIKKEKIDYAIKFLESRINCSGSRNKLPYNGKEIKLINLMRT